MYTRLLSTRKGRRTRLEKPAKAVVISIFPIVQGDRRVSNTQMKGIEFICTICTYLSVSLSRYMYISISGSISRYISAMLLYPRLSANAHTTLRIGTYLISCLAAFTAEKAHQPAIDCRSYRVSTIRRTRPYVASRVSCRYWHHSADRSCC